MAKNKALDTPIIEVTPIETTPMVDGELTDAAALYESEGEDASGGSYKTSTPAAATLKATWLPFGSSNRKTSPDVRRGERVILMRFGDTDQFFWLTLWDDLHLRKLETVLYAFSGTRAEGAPITADNYYFLEISTHNKLIHFHTSKADGEPFTYDIQINTKDGTILITDDIGNYFSFDSKGRQIEIKNADGSLMEVNRKNINITCDDTITMQALNIVEKSTNQTQSTTNFALTSSDAKLRASTSTLAMGAMQGSADSGDLVIAGISHVSHTHGGVKAGGDSTSGPQ